MSYDRTAIAEACARHLQQVRAADVRELTNATGTKAPASLVAVVLAQDGRFEHVSDGTWWLWRLAPPRPPRLPVVPASAPMPPPKAPRPQPKPRRERPPLPALSNQPLRATEPKLVAWLRANPGEWPQSEIARRCNVSSQGINLQVKRWASYLVVRYVSPVCKLISLRQQPSAADGSPST